MNGGGQRMHDTRQKTHKGGQRKHDENYNDKDREVKKSCRRDKIHWI